MKTLTAITGVEGSAVWGQQAQQTSIINTDNRSYPRNITLSTQGVRVSRLGVAVGFPIADLIAAAILLEPTLSWPPVITTQPASITSNNAGAASFSIIVNSELPVTYQWQISTNGGNTWTSLTDTGVYSGTTTSVLLISAALGLNSYQYRCVTLNGSGTTTSNSASITVDPDVTSGPANLTVTAPAAATFTVVAFGLTALSYQWQLSTDGGATWGDLTNTGVYTNVTTATLNISNSTGLNTNQYRCTVHDTAGTIHSNAAILTVL